MIKFANGLGKDVVLREPDAERFLNSSEKFDRILVSWWKDDLNHVPDYKPLLWPCDTLPGSTSHGANGAMRHGNCGIYGNFGNLLSTGAPWSDPSVSATSVSP